MRESMFEKISLQPTNVSIVYYACSYFVQCSNLSSLNIKKLKHREYLVNKFQSRPGHQSSLCLRGCIVVNTQKRLSVEEISASREEKTFHGGIFGQFAVKPQYLDLSLSWIPVILVVFRIRLSGNQLCNRSLKKIKTKSLLFGYILNFTNLDYLITLPFCVCVPNILSFTYKCSYL